MDVESLAKELILKGMTDEQQKAVLDSIKGTMETSRQLQKQRVGEQATLVIQALKKIESDITSRYDELGNKIVNRVESIKDGVDGKNGRDGVNGRDGRAGRDGAQGPKGADGINGANGQDGVDGVSVTDAHIDFDGSLIINLSSGQVLNVGEVVAPELADKIKVISSGGGTAQIVLDTLASLQTQINNIYPSQTGNAGKFLTTNGTAVSWATVSGGGGGGGLAAVTGTAPIVSSGGTSPDISINAATTSTAGSMSAADKTKLDGIATGATANTGTVTSVSGTGTVSGVTLTGTVTSSGSLTLGGTLAVTAANFASQTANTILAAPNGIAGVPTFRSIVSQDVPTLNQNTTGTASNVTGTVVVGNGGTGVTTLTGLVKGNGTSAFSAATAGTDYVTPTGTETLTNKTLTDPKIILGGTNGTTGQALLSTGTGVAPVWGSVAGAPSFLSQSYAGDNGVISLRPAPANFGII